MLNQFSRTQLLLGKAAMDRLQQAHVAVFGIGGVGGYVCEALVRSGIGAFDLIDDDRVCLTNLNRQIIATRKTVGKYKAEVMAERIHDINPNAQITVRKTFFLPENAEAFPSAFRVADIYETKVCPLARIMRRELRKRGVKHLKVVYSQEPPIRPLENMSISCRSHCICPPGTQHKCTDRRDIPGSNAFVPSVAGLIIAGEVIRDLTAGIPVSAEMQDAPPEPK